MSLFTSLHGHAVGIGRHPGNAAASNLLPVGVRGESPGWIDDRSHEVGIGRSRQAPATL